jgi:hypothetical protein
LNHLSLGEQSATSATFEGGFGYDSDRKAENRFCGASG